MSAQVNPVKLGLFVLLSLVLFLAGLLILGGDSMWRKRFGVETYLNESAQGLDVGSAVKMRGVQIGHIESISFVYVKYPEAFQAGYRYVLVEIGLIMDRFGDVPEEDFSRLLKMEVEKGLRIRIAPQGLTGTAYLELDYADPLRARPLPKNWEPSRPYIPSAPGTIARLEETFESMSKTLSNLAAVNIADPLDRLEALLLSAQEKVDAVRTDLITEQALALLEELRQTNRQAALLLGRKDGESPQGGDIYTILEDISKTMREVRFLAEDLSGWSGSEEGGLEDLRTGVASLRQSLELAPELMRDFSETARAGRESLDQVRELTRQMRLRLAFQQEQLEKLLHNLERTSENLREITDDARVYPSRVLFGDPPQNPEQ